MSNETQRHPFFFFNDTATTEIYTLSLHDALPISFGPQLPRILAGTSPALAIDDLQAFGLRAPQEAARDKLTRAFEELYDGTATGLLASSSQEGFAAIQVLKRVNPAQYQPANGAEYPPGRFGRSMLQIAQLIKAGVGLEIAFADLGGWDTHVNQGSRDGQLAARLRELGLGLPAFAQDLGDGMRNVVGLPLSGLRRTIAAHGHRGPQPGPAAA